MNFNTWLSNINKLNLNGNIKNNLVSFFENYHDKNSLDFIKLEDKELIDAFNNINNYKPISICLDIEFQLAIVDDDKYISLENFNKEKMAKFIREFGILFFIKDINEDIFYVGSIFVNFDSLENFGFNRKNIRLNGVKYSTVNENTSEKINELETVFHIDDYVNDLEDENLYNNNKKLRNKVDQILKKLSSNYLFNNLLKDNTKNLIKAKLHSIKNTSNNPKRDLKIIKKQLHNTLYELFPKYLNNELSSIFDKINNLYWNDKLVKKRLSLLKNNPQQFLEIFERLSNDSVLIVKGTMDINAIKNTHCLFIDDTVPKLENTYDIETFNGFSYNHFKSSQLEDTYKNLIDKKIYKRIAKSFFDKIFVPL